MSEIKPIPTLAVAMQRFVEWQADHLTENTRAQLVWFDPNGTQREVSEDDVRSHSDSIWPGRYEVRVLGPGDAVLMRWEAEEPTPHEPLKKRLRSPLYDVRDYESLGDIIENGIDGGLVHVLRNIYAEGRTEQGRLTGLVYADCSEIRQLVKHGLIVAYRVTPLGRYVIGILDRITITTGQGHETGFQYANPEPQRLDGCAPADVWNGVESKIATCDTLPRDAAASHSTADAPSKPADTGKTHVKLGAGRYGLQAGANPADPEKIRDDLLAINHRVIAEKNAALKKQLEDVQRKAAALEAEREVFRQTVSAVFLEADGRSLRGMMRVILRGQWLKSFAAEIEAQGKVGDAYLDEILQMWEPYGQMPTVPDGYVAEAWDECLGKTGPAGCTFPFRVRVVRRKKDEP